MAFAEASPPTSWAAEMTIALTLEEGRRRLSECCRLLGAVTYVKGT